MKRIFFLILIVSSLVINAQDNKSTNKILESYLTELKLDDTQTQQFIIVYNKYKNQLNSETIENNEFNKINKKRDLELYKLFTKEKLNLYRKLKRELEPSFGFRM